MNEPKVRYVWFDFHHECRNMKYQNLSKLVKEVNSEFDRFGYFSMDPSGKVTATQGGVMRTNCVDNLDRTNVVQSLFGRLSVVSQFKLQSDDVLNCPYVEFEKTFKNFWGDHADKMSVVYSGTGALKTDFTRTGKRTLNGAINDGVNSLTRFYLNNLCDGERQDSIDVFLGYYHVDPSIRSYYAEEQPPISSSSPNAVLRVLFVLFTFLVALFTFGKMAKFKGRLLADKPHLRPSAYERTPVEERNALSPKGLALLEESKKKKDKKKPILLLAFLVLVFYLCYRSLD